MAQYSIHAINLVEVNHIILSDRHERCEYFSLSGLVDEDAFHHWFVELFMKNVDMERPVILLLSEKESHLGYSLVEMARKKNVS